MNHTYTAKDGTEIELELEASIGNNGIGSYEFQGQRCFDRGDTIVEGFSIESISDEAYRAEVEEWLAGNPADLQEEAIEQEADDYIAAMEAKSDSEQDR
tara:strand:- start:593 stop:889 length:297 start_codon:yes stop_codon:yes gene_type:complete